MPQVGRDGLLSIAAGEKIQMDFPLSGVITHKCLSEEARHILYDLRIQEQR